MNFQFCNLRVASQGAKIVPLLLLVAALCGCSAAPSEAMKLDTSAAITNETSVEKLIDRYKHWTRVNPVPVVFHSFGADSCAPVAMPQSPHSDKFITVYVNELGRKPMMEMKTPHFPYGSIIVKEKLRSKDSTSPELLTVMIKREAGFNPKNGDWEYAALDGAGKQVQARGRLENCQACHTMVSDTDFIYRKYLPAAVWEKLL